MSNLKALLREARRKLIYPIDSDGSYYWFRCAACGADGPLVVGSLICAPPTSQLPKHKPGCLVLRIQDALGEIL